MFKDFAGCVKDCSTLKHNKRSGFDNGIQMICMFYKKDWLNQNGTLNNSIRSRYDEIPGVSKNINKCLVLPSMELFEKLQCIGFMINNGLDHCLEKVLKSKNKTIRYENCLKAKNFQ